MNGKCKDCGDEKELFEFAMRMPHGIVRATICIQCKLNLEGAFNEELKYCKNISTDDLPKLFHS